MEETLLFTDRLLYKQIKKNSRERENDLCLSALKRNFSLLLKKLADKLEI